MEKSQSPLTRAAIETRNTLVLRDVELRIATHVVHTAGQVRFGYVYALECPVLQRIRYFGKTVDPRGRWRQQLRNAQVPALVAWIADLRRQDLVPRLHIVAVEAASELQDIEASWIARFKEDPYLLNTLGTGGRASRRRRRAHLTP